MPLCGSHQGTIFHRLTTCTDSTKSAEHRRLQRIQGHALRNAARGLIYVILWFMYFCMKLTISSTDAVRSFGDCLARIKHRGDSFLITKNNNAVAMLVPAHDTSRGTINDVIAALREAPAADSGFADDLARANAKDIPSNPWDSSSTRRR